MIDLFVIGTSHRFAPVELRSRVAFAEEELPRAMADLAAEIASECVILSTCNRTEIYVVPQAESVGPKQVRDWLAENRGMQLEEGHFFTLTSVSAARHLMEVAAGIDSQVIGDVQILGQVKEAYRTAREQGRTGKLLSRVFETALRTGKRVKTETELFTGAVSISYVAVELARKIFYPLKDQRTLVVGAGETGELTVISLKGRGVRDITVTNRTERRGRDLLERLGTGSWLPMDRMRDELHRFDIVVVATGARDYILDYATVKAAAERHAGETMLIVDLSVPRNVDPRVSGIGKVFCKDLNDLNSVIAENVERRREEVPRAEAIVSEELDDLIAWGRMLPVTPVIAELRGRADAIVRETLEESKIGREHLPEVERLVGRVVKRLIDLPLAHLLEAGHDPEGARRKAEYVRMLFNLDQSGLRDAIGKSGDGPPKNQSQTNNGKDGNGG